MDWLPSSRLSHRLSHRLRLRLPLCLSLSLSLSQASSVGPPRDMAAATAAAVATALADGSRFKTLGNTALRDGDVPAALKHYHYVRRGVETSVDRSVLIYGPLTRTLPCVCVCV